MPPSIAAPLFAVSLAGTLAAAAFFARRLDRVGLRLGLPEAMLGLLTAAAADAPEVAAAGGALGKGQHSVAGGVVVGSNAFNLAAMRGGSAMVAAGLRTRRETLLLEGVVALWIAGVVSLLAEGTIGAPVALALLACVAVPYVALLALGERHAGRLPLPPGIVRFLRRTFGERHRPEHDGEHHGEVVLLTVLLLGSALAAIVAGSIGMVTAAVDLADSWSVPRALVGVLVLAVLTSLPNAATGIRLGLQRRGSALVSETLNSNSINLIAGIAVPALVIGLGPLSRLDAFDLVWVASMTAAALAMMARRRGTGKAGGLLLVGLYGVFVAVQLAALA